MKTIRIYALANEMAIDEDNTSEIFIPFGSWPYGLKAVVGTNGSESKVFVTQKFDLEGAKHIATLISDTVAKGNPGIPIYWGHPDVPDVAAKFPDKRAKGWIRKAEVSERGLKLFDIEWLDDPASGFGWFSPYWHGVPTMTDKNNATVEINEIISVGLTNQPNILDFRLANEAEYETTTSGTAAQPKDKTMDREKLLEVLGLPPETTDEQIIAEITKLKTTAADSATKLEAANAEIEAEKQEKEKAETALANERTARVNIMLDNAIADGRISPAARPAWAKRLAEDPANGAIALANEKPLKTMSVTGNLNQAAANGSDSIMALANEKVAKGMSFELAWAAVKRERPELFK